MNSLLHSKVFQLTVWSLIALLAVPAVSARAASTDPLDPINMPPRFVGLSTGSAPINSSIALELAFAYMTAPEMQSKVRSLTGYVHPAFDAYGDVLGRYDSRTGLRTNDRPSLVTVLFMQKIADAVAQAVVDREIFLDDQERIVYQGTDLSAAPSDNELQSVIDGLYGRWLSQATPAAVLTELCEGFRKVEQANGPTKAFVWLTAMMIRHGGLYYY